MFGDFPFRLTNYYDSALIGELISQDIKVVESEVVAIARNKEGRIIWLKQGTVRRGLNHILAGHGEDGAPNRRFSTYFGVSDDPETIGNFIFNSIARYPPHLVVPRAGELSKLYIHQIRRNSEINYLKILVDDEGEIITAFPDRNEN